MTNYDLDYCQRRRAEYAAGKDEPGFDKEKLLDMDGGCAYRRALRRTDLTAKQQQVLRELIGIERPDLWS